MKDKLIGIHNEVTNEISTSKIINVKVHNSNWTTYILENGIKFNLETGYEHEYNYEYAMLNCAIKCYLNLDMFYDEVVLPNLNNLKEIERVVKNENNNIK